MRLLAMSAEEEIRRFLQFLSNGPGATIILNQISEKDFTISKNDPCLFESGCHRSAF